MEEILKLINSEEDSLNKKLEETLKGKAILSIKKYDNGKAEVQIEGSSLALLIALARLEKKVLERLNVPKELYELIKYKIGTKEAE